MADMEPEPPRRRLRHDHDHVHHDHDYLLHEHAVARDWNTIVLLLVGLVLVATVAVVVLLSVLGDTLFPSRPIPPPPGQGARPGVPEININIQAPRQPAGETPPSGGEARPSDGSPEGPGGGSTGPDGGSEAPGGE